MTKPSRLAVACAAVLAAVWSAAPARAADDPPAPTTERLKVADPYLELRTGPGRGYPVFHVAARDEWVLVESRKTDWYKVRTDGGQEGWVHRTQLETTLTEAGVRKGFRDVLLDDFLARRLELGAATGRFKAEPMLKLWAGYRLSETLSLEASAGQVQGLFSGSSWWHVNLLNEPWADKRLSPFFGVGFGQFRNIPNNSLVDATRTDARLANAVVGARWYLSRRFVLRADYTVYTAFVADERSAEYRAVSAGLSFFF